MRKIILSKLSALVAVALGGAIFFFPEKQAGMEEVTVKKVRDYADIVQSGHLRAVTEYNALAFHVKGDSLSGFHYELANAFARSHGLVLDIEPEANFERRLNGLLHGQYDLIANGIVATSEQKDSFLLTVPIMLNREVLVQRRKDLLEDSTRFVKSLLQLAGKTVYVEESSPTKLRIRNLGNEIGDTIYINELALYGPEQLVAMVAHGDIEYAVCDESIARIAADSLPQIDISTAISFNQFYSWGVNRRSPALRDSLNAWLLRFMKTKEYRKLYRKYYVKEAKVKGELLTAHPSVGIGGMCLSYSSFSHLSSHSKNVRCHRMPF